MVARPLWPNFYIHRLYLFGHSGLKDYGFATLQNLIPSFTRIAPPHPPAWHNPRKGRDQILPSGNLVYNLSPCREVSSATNGFEERCLKFESVLCNSPDDVSSDPRIPRIVSPERFEFVQRNRMTHEHDELRSVKGGRGVMGSHAL